MPTKVETTGHSTFLRALARALAADARAQVRAEVELAMKVGVLLASGLPHREIALKLDVTAAEVSSASERLRRVAPTLEGEALGLPFIE